MGENDKLCPVRTPFTVSTVLQCKQNSLNSTTCLKKNGGFKLSQFGFGDVVWCEMITQASGKSVIWVVIWILHFADSLQTKLEMSFGVK